MTDFPFFFKGAFRGGNDRPLKRSPIALTEWRRAVLHRSLSFSRAPNGVKGKFEICKQFRQLSKIAWDCSLLKKRWAYVNVFS